MKPREVRKMIGDFLTDEYHEDFSELFEAFYSITPQQQQVLRLYFEEYYDYEEIGNFYQIEPWQAEKRVSRAVYALTGRVNRSMTDESYEASRGQWDTRGKGRKAISNAAARLRTDGSW